MRTHRSSSKTKQSITDRLWQVRVRLVVKADVHNSFTFAPIRVGRKAFDDYARSLRADGREDAEFWGRWWVEDNTPALNYRGLTIVRDDNLAADEIAGEDGERFLEREIIEGWREFAKALDMHIKFGDKPLAWKGRARRLLNRTATALVKAGVIPERLPGLPSGSPWWVDPELAPPAPARAKSRRSKT
jgi:hypothetical protein